MCSRNMGRYWDSSYYTPSEPKEVKDGVRLQSSKIGATWWSKRWIHLLEGFGWSNRLARGKKYARRGQVINFEIQAGVIKAQVQGTTSEPYSISIRIKKFSNGEWEQAIKIISSQAIFSAKLLSGEMPENIEEAFGKAKISLFPEREKDFKSDCSCPDWANPCKHIAAVHYVLADEFDRDPFMIFKIRGRTKEKIVEQVSKQWAKSSGKEKRPLKTSQLKLKEERVIPLKERIPEFWKSDEKLKTLSFDIQSPEVPLSLIRRLGPPSFWRGSPDFQDEMKRIYKAVTRKAIETAYSK